LPLPFYSRWKLLYHPSKCLGDWTGRPAGRVRTELSPADPPTHTTTNMKKRCWYSAWYTIPHRPM
jgi:hypothetical protein